MHTKRLMKEWLPRLVATCAVLAVLPGCELLVDFDRTKIPSDGGLTDVTFGDGGSSDATVPEENAVTGDGGDGATPDATVIDAAGDVSAEDVTVDDGAVEAGDETSLTGDASPVDATDESVTADAADGASE